MTSLELCSVQPAQPSVAALWTIICWVQWWPAESREYRREEGEKGREEGWEADLATLFQVPGLRLPQAAGEPHAVLFH